MKLLQKREIDSSKAQERKHDIDEGMKLATTVDKLRQTMATEQKNLLDFRANAVKEVSLEIAHLTLERDSLIGEIKNKQEARAELIKPLNKEWKELSLAKEEFKEEKIKLYLERESLKTEIENIQKEKDKISEIARVIKLKENETDKSKKNAISLEEMAQRSYELARIERETQTENHEKEMSKAFQLQKEYEVALSLIQIRENEVNEKEVELLKERKHLESQQAQLRIVKEALKQ